MPSGLGGNERTGALHAPLPAWLQPGEARGDPNLNLRRSEELRLYWVAILCERIKADVAIPGGVHMVEDVIKSLVDGAKVARMTSALRKEGVAHWKTMRADIEARMEKYEYPSIHQRQGIMS